MVHPALSMRSAAAGVALLALLACCGAVSSGESVPLLIALKQRNLDVLEARFWEVANPRSAMYGHHMSADDIRRVIGTEPEDVELVSSWLVAQGARVPVRLLATGDYLVAHFDAPAAATTVLRTATSAFPGLVELVTRADPNALTLGEDLVMASAAAAARREDGPTTAQFTAKRGLLTGKSGSPLAFGDPNTQRSAYGIPASERGSASQNKQMVWGPGTYGFLDSDLQAFYSDLKVNESTSLLHHLGFKGVPGGDNFGEATLDVSYISGIGQGITTLVYNSNSSMSTEEGNGFGAALLHFAASLATGTAPAMPVTLSISLGSLTFKSCDMLCAAASNNTGVSYQECSQYMQQQRQVCMFLAQDQITRTSTEFMKIGLRGVSVLAATGDGGSHYSFQPFPSDRIGSLLNQAACAKNFPTYPASDPYVTGVGGTSWPGSPSEPVPWDGSGGGFSWTFKQPQYQAAAVSAYLKDNAAALPPPDAFAASNRAYPDVAALASGIPMVVDGQFTLTGGTSASTPEFSGIISLINDRRLAAGLKPLGFLNTRLYMIAAEHPGEAFYDMTTGTSACTSAGSCCPTSTSFTAAKAWDPLTGLGSPVWDGLVKYLSTDTTL